ncbi:unnamed protein product [Adineta ricciae]|uniref:G-protein coupled receptors family 1 profile domain-containing protein n=1 Tax=Adineta ricciae TaxID=249248 RepID=A0A814WFE8_ADIRI|nr:unnamed protein product [Adineta ricciae]CAF1409961.1 unnamed protein product [Adineta ricciae]
MGTKNYYPLFDSSFTSYISNDSIFDSINPNSLDQSNHLAVSIAIWIILLITILFGTTGNILVLYVYISRKDNKTCTFFITMLAGVDLIICLILAPLELYQVTTGIQNEFLCKFYGFLSTHVLYSTFLITVIAFDRYFCICWPLYKIITVRRARAIVIICGIVSSLLAIMPMSEFSTVDHALQVLGNHSEQFLSKPLDTNDFTYKHVDHIKTASISSYILGNETSVVCSPRFSLRLKLPIFIDIYRKFHSSLFAICMLLVIILYAFIYNAVYQRRITRTRKFSAYRRIIRSYLIHNEPELSESESSKMQHHHRYHRRSRRYHGKQPSTLTLLCCYCCKINDDYMHDLQRPSEGTLTAPLSERNRQSYRRHNHDEPSCIDMNPNRNRPKIVLEVNGARGKRYSAISMTSMTYLTSGVWDDSSPTSLIRSRINSIAATTYCGTENSSTSRPSTSTEDSFEQTSRLLTLNNTLLQLRPMSSTTATNPTHLTVPGLQMTTGTTLSPASSSSSTGDAVPKENSLTENELPRSVSQCANLLHPSYIRKPSNTLSTRTQARPSDASVPQRKVSFLTSSGTTADRCINEDTSSTCPRASLAPSNFPVAPNQSQNNPAQHNLAVHMSSTPRSLSTVSAIDHSNPLDRALSISSTRRPSTFDCETQRTLERQQTQERLANIRTTFTLFIVTSTFILMYLPSIIHILFDIQNHTYREVLFLLCYVNSACNPLIYSFFNVNFRNDVRRLYECQKREYLARRY